jgi:biopolymer transport protein ExbB/TolQ
MAVTNEMKVAVPLRAARARKSRWPGEFMFSMIALITTIIVVQSVYAIVIRPRAVASLERDYALAKTDATVKPGRSIYVIIKDYEQESCIVLMVWSLLLLGYKTATLTRDRRLLDADVVHVPEGMRILPQDAREYSRQIEQLSPDQRDLLLPRAATAALDRFGATQNVQDAAEASRAVCESEAARLDSENAMLRYTAWAIPAIGFIGTVRGIGNALGTAHRAMSGDITGVTEGLGITFNSTFIALLLSIMVMFLLHQLQLAQERLVLRTESYIDQKLVRHMRGKS